MLGRVASLDLFVSVAFMPLSIALTGVLSQYLEPRMLFLGAALLPLATAITLGALGQLHTPGTSPGSLEEKP